LASFQAQSATTTIAQAFNLAFECWLSANERKRNREGNQGNKRAKECGWKRTENSEHKVIDVKKNINDAIAKCEDIVEGLDSNMSKDHLTVGPPSLFKPVILQTDQKLNAVIKRLEEKIY
jgi:hypothetical protein